jgi:hypothetical protein
MATPSPPTSQPSPTIFTHSSQSFHFTLWCDVSTHLPNPCSSSHHLHPLITSHSPRQPLSCSGNASLSTRLSTRPRSRSLSSPHHPTPRPFDMPPITAFFCIKFPRRCTVSYCIARTSVPHPAPPPTDSPIIIAATVIVVATQTLGWPTLQQHLGLMPSRKTSERVSSCHQRMIDHKQRYEQNQSAVVSRTHSYLPLTPFHSRPVARLIVLPASRDCFASHSAPPPSLPHLPTLIHHLSLSPQT